MAGKETQASRTGESRNDLPSWIALGLLAGLLTWGYWSPLGDLAIYWAGPQYAHGWLIPMFAAAMLWIRQEPITAVAMAERWWGVGLLALGLLCRLICAYFGLRLAEMVTFVPCLASLLLLVGGWRMFRWAGPVIAFLVFMFPLPWSMENVLLDPLQAAATKVSTFVLQTVGIEAYQEGNRICISGLPRGVVDACSRLRMTTIIAALSVAVLLITDRSWWERIVILLSAVPIALLVNVVRITVTGILYWHGGTALAQMIFHDLAGWVMLSLALGLLVLELYVLSHIFYEVDREQTAPTFG